MKHKIKRIFGILHPQLTQEQLKISDIQIIDWLEFVASIYDLQLTNIQFFTLLII